MRGAVPLAGRAAALFGAEDAAPAAFGFTTGATPLAAPVVARGVAVAGLVAVPAEVVAGLLGVTAGPAGWPPPAAFVAAAPVGVVPGAVVPWDLAFPAASTSVLLGTVGRRSARISEARNGPRSFASGIFSVMCVTISTSSSRSRCAAGMTRMFRNRSLPGADEATVP